MTAIYGLDGTADRVGGGCSLAWAPDSSYLYFVGSGGRQKNLFGRFDPKTGERKRWIDLHGAFSHEYFPKVSNDGRYLIFGVSAGGHELDVADYEIFLWEIGVSWDDSIRITFNPSNDSWPDIYVYAPPPARQHRRPAAPALVPLAGWKGWQ